MKSTASKLTKHLRKNMERLIDGGVLHQEASNPGLSERYGRGETSHTIHVWWARRPHSTMRALIFASLCKENSNLCLDTLRHIGSSSIVSNGSIYQARKQLWAQYKRPPKLLDMFGGGGTIPMEAANLGAETYSVDANELSVFIQRCNLIYSQSVDTNNIRSVIRSSGERILQKLTSETNKLFPLRNLDVAGYPSAGIVAYIWTYTSVCPNCGYRFYLSKRTFLSKKKGNSLGLIIRDGEHRQSVVIDKIKGDVKNQSALDRSGIVSCPKCEHKTSKMDIKQCQDEIVALVASKKGHGKEYLPFKEDCIINSEELKDIENSLVNELEIDLPDSILPCWSGIVNPAIYGITTHTDFLNQRQRIVLLFLIKILREEYTYLLASENKDTSRYVISLLSSFIDQLVDWNCRLSMWISQNEQVGRSFCGPGVAMLWDYAEIDPVSQGPANLWSKLQRIINGAKSITKYPHPAYVEQGYAQWLPFTDKYFDAIITDPPYYDNIYYNILADFFYAWKRLILQKLEPDLFKTSSTNDEHELVASKFRNGTAEKAHEKYCEQLTLALKEAERVLKNDGIFSFLYSHGSLKGWEALLRAYRATNFQITSVEPLNVERKHRPRAMTSKAINTCMAIIARKSKHKKQPTLMNAFIDEFKEFSASFVQKLIDSGWDDNDLSIALFANGVGMLANVSKLKDCENDIEALKKIEDVVKNAATQSFSIKDRRSL